MSLQVKGLSSGSTLLRQLSGYYPKNLSSLSKAVAPCRLNRLRPMNNMTPKRSEHMHIEDFLDVKVDRSKEGETYVESIPISTGREKVLIKKESEACVLCRLNLRDLNYTDVLIISQFIKKDGSMATFHESRLCTKQYKRITKMIQQAQRCQLLPRPNNYLSPGPWHDFNTYLKP